MLIMGFGAANVKDFVAHVKHYVMQYLSVFNGSSLL